MRSFTFFLACTLSASFRVRHGAKQVALVLTPADADRDAYVHALSTTNRFCPLRCAREIVQPSSTAELAGWIRANNGTAFTVKGGGHSYGCQSVPVDGGVMIHTERLNEAKVYRRPDGSAFVRAGAGMTFDELIPRLAKMGYSMPHGECLTVGLGGWTLNMGQHPELKNFDNEWGYGKGNPWLTKATFVNYAGSIFTVEADGLHLVELGQESLLGWHSRALATQLKGSAMSWFADGLVAAGPVMRVMQIYGASLSIATEFEIELIPKPEPGFFQVTYGISDILDETDGKGQRLMQAIFDVVANGGPDPNLDCGIFYASHYFNGTREGALALKCTDWVSETGATIERVAPPGYRQFGPKASGFLFWTRDSYGKGWVPMWHAEDLENFKKAGGSEKYRGFLRRLEEGDGAGPNPCDACSSELMYMLEPAKTPYVMFDNFCSATQSNQDACSMFVFRNKAKFLDNREIMYKQNLPSCPANSNWKSQVGEYSMGGWELGTTLKWTWDPSDVVDFWLSLGSSEPNGRTCEAAHVVPVGALCQAHGIGPDDLVEAELAKVRSKCPLFDTYTDFDSQNNLCSSHVYDSATVLSVADA